MLFYARTKGNHRMEGTSTGRKKIEDGFKNANARYDAVHTQFIGLKLNTGTDSDILQWIETQPSKQGAIKTAIRHYLASVTSTDEK